MPHTFRERDQFYFSYNIPQNMDVKLQFRIAHKEPILFSNGGPITREDVVSSKRPMTHSIYFNLERF